MKYYSQELILPNRDLPFRMFVFEGRYGHYVREMHWHKEIEIFAVIDGELDFIMDSEKHTLRGNECVLVNQNEIHSIICPTPNLTLVVQIPTAFLSYENQDPPLYFRHRKADQEAELVRMIRSMYETYRRKETGANLEVLSNFYHILFLLMKFWWVPDPPESFLLSNRNLDRLSRITDYLQTHYQESLPLQEVARHFGYTPTYLSHMFRNYAHTTYRNYLQNLRLDHAFRMLNQTALPIREIAERNGFAGSKAFSHVFRKKYGILPSGYRKRKAEEMGQ